MVKSSHCFGPGKLHSVWLVDDLSVFVLFFFWLTILVCAVCYVVGHLHLLHFPCICLFVFTGRKQMLKINKFRA